MEDSAQTSRGPKTARALLPAAIVVLTLLAVFVLPWLVPVPVRALVSESQAAGFSNRTALVALALGGLALAAVSLLRSRGDDPAAPFVLGRPGTEGGVDGRLVTLTAAGTAAFVLALASVYRGSPFSDAQYFIDRMAYVGAGAVPYAEVEFPYGPLLLYPPLLLGKGFALLGVPYYWGYYLFLAVLQVLGVVLLAWVVGRLRALAGFKDALFAVAAAFAAFQLTLGANLSLVRYLLPFGASLWALGAVTRSSNAAWRTAAPLLAVAAALAVSPEMAVATLFALLAGLGRIALNGPRRWPSLLLPLLGAGAVLAVAVLSTPGMFTAFAGGAYQLPLLPGPYALAYVAAALTLAWGAGRGAASADEGAAAASVAWATAALVLAAASLGRADVLHLFGNGLGAFLGAAAVIPARAPRLAKGAVAVVGTVFLTGAAVFQLSAMGPGAMASAVSGGRLSVSRAERAGHLLGDPKWASRYAEASVALRGGPLARALAGEGRVAFLMPVDPALGAELGARDALAPSYTWPQFAVNEALVERMLEQASHADALVLPKGDYQRYRAAARRRSGAAAPMAMPSAVGGELRYRQLMLFPVALPARNPVLDTAALVGEALERDWTHPRELERYVVLRRR